MKAHEVRSLVRCYICSNIGDMREMIELPRPYRGKHVHGRCYINKYGIEKLLHKHRDQVGKLTLSDVGNNNMRRIVEEVCTRAKASHGAGT